MRRVQTFVGQQVYEWLFSSQAQNNMTALAKLCAAIFGTSGAVNGLACSPTTPASMSVNIGQGEIYQIASLEATACGTLPVDNSDVILKQGIQFGSNTLSGFAAPSTPGQSISYLVCAQYQDSDISLDPTTGATSVVLQFYNAAAPTSPLSGPNNSGASSNTFRDGIVAYSVAAGISAVTGSQVIPSPPAGWIGLWVVTVAYGQTTITSSNIAAYSGAPFINSTLFGQSPAFQVSPTAPTPPQFDATTKSATMAALTRMGMQSSGFALVSSNTTLTNAVVGGTVQVSNNTGPVTLTLPLTTGIAPAVGRIEFVNSGVYPVTLIAQGADRLSHINATTPSGGIVLLPGDNLTVVCQGAGIWLAVGGSAELALSALFAGSIQNNGYQKLPSGFIIQWGLTNTAVAANTATAISFTFPVAFPNACLFASATPGNYVGSSRTAEAYTTTSVNGFALNSAAVTLATRWFAIGW